MAGTTVALLSSVAGAVATSLLAPKAPKAQKPVAMPGADAEAAARRKSIMEQQQRQGRASTILTDSASDTLG